MKALSITFCFLMVIITSCQREDTIAPLILPNTDTITHYFGDVYIDAGAEVLDDKDCDAGPAEIILNEVDIYHYGSYNVKYYAEDNAGNSSRVVRKVNIVLKPEQYYDLTYAASDTCTSGNYYYDALIQDCDCEINAVTIANISNFGSSATFTIPLSGTYNHILKLSDTLYDISFFGSGEMSPGADTIRWSYSISDSVNTDACTSVWVKN